MFSLDPHSKYFYDTVSFFIKLIAGAGGLYLFFIGIRRYGKEQNWRRQEFVAKEIKEFNTDPMAINAMYILDWGARYVELFPDNPNYDDRFAKVDRTLLKSALQYHEFKIDNPHKDRFSRTEVAVRDSFDCFFSYFERFEHFIESGLISVAELQPYLQYWMDTIAEDIEDDVRNFIVHFIDRYNYRGTQRLFKRFDKNIYPITDIETTKSI